MGRHTTWSRQWTIYFLEERKAGYTYNGRVKKKVQKARSLKTERLNDLTYALEVVATCNDTFV
jgi:hypothetical protein